MDEVALPESKTSGLTGRLRRKLERYAAALGWRAASIVNCRSHLQYAMTYRPDSDYFFGGVADYRECFAKWISGNEANNCGDLGRFYCIYQNVTHIVEQNIPGDFVELGVFKGNSAAILAYLGRKYRRNTYLFDTFSGFDDRDLKGVDGHREIQFADTSIEAVQRLVGTELVTYVKGFFPESAGKTTLPETIAVAHIDCDLYGPMKAGLEIFYPRVAAGGLIILHDYSSGWWPGAKGAVDEFFAGRAERPVLMPDKSGTAVIRKVCSGNSFIQGQGGVYS